MRLRGAPTAARTASSCCRTAPRANSKIDTFPHPIASSSVTAPNSRYSVPLMLLTTHPLIEPLHFHLEEFGEMLGHVLGKLFEQRLQCSVRRMVGHTSLQEEINDIHFAWILGQLQRQVDIRDVPGESRRRNAYDLIVLVVQLQRLS